MTVQVANAQREAPVSPARMTRFARRAIRRLGIRARGRLAITFIERHRMRRLNRRFLRHDRPTDVLSFRYDGPSTRPDGLARDVAPRDVPAGRHEQIVGDILIAPAQARTYARRHGVPYAEELARYVVHGLLHWLGQEDRTAAERHTMRAREDRLLLACLNGGRVRR
ncbi:MAG: rRNA maturation RNase YbeY [Candidatus Omnitrophica bacterium]|nr:rRNA maturation RNase YbeY [Candidatus Omnitrophota bacterium]